MSTHRSAHVSAGGHRRPLSDEDEVVARPCSLFRAHGSPADRTPPQRRRAACPPDDEIAGRRPRCLARLVRAARREMLIESAMTKGQSHLSRDCQPQNHREAVIRRAVRLWRKQGVRDLPSPKTRVGARVSSLPLFFLFSLSSPVRPVCTHGFGAREGLTRSSPSSLPAQDVPRTIFQPAAII